MTLLDKENSLITMGIVLKVNYLKENSMDLVYIDMLMENTLLVIII